MDKYYEIELALCNAVDKKIDFHQSAGSISSIVSPVKNPKEAEQVLDKLLDFLLTYRSGS